MDELPKISMAEFLSWMIRRRRRFRVTERSMLPLLKPGDEVLVNPMAYQQTSPQPSDIVVAQHPHQVDFLLIKRVVAKTDTDHYFLQGDNLSESTDSRTFGAVSAGKIIGRVTCRFA